MGKGDIKTRRGKINNHSYGNNRPQKRLKNKPKASLEKNKIKSFTSQNWHSKTQVCYNCGKEFETKDITKEHIPARNLFVGYDEKYKVNRITVPACSECNGKYSPTDKEFRNMIGVIAKRKENQTIVEKATKSFLEKESNLQRLSVNRMGKITGISFNQTPIEDFHKKNFKGLFYHQYGKCLPDNYKLFVNIDENDYSGFTLGILGYLKDLFEWKKSGHSDILSYVIQPFRLGLSNDSKKDLVPQNDENIYAGCLIYNKEHGALVIAVREEYFKTLNK